MILNKILLVEDNIELWDGVKKLLLDTPYSLICCSTVSDATQYLCNDQIDLVLLDLILNDENGKSVIKYIRRQNPLLPIIILSSLSDLETRKEVFTLGADDYLIKPYSSDELLMRIERSLERSRLNPTNETLKNCIKVGDLTLDLQDEKLIYNDESIVLRKKLYNILLLFMQNPNCVIRKETLHSIIWKDELLDENSISVHIHQLRKKISMIEDIEIVTVPKVGYRFYYKEHQNSL